MSASSPDSESTQSSSGYEDGLGRRVLAFDRETGDMLERLVLRPELSAFEPALKERMAIVVGLEDERFMRPRAVERDADDRLTVVSEFVAGRRLSDVLDAAAEHGIIAGLDAGLGLLLELLPALARIHDAGLAHGALAPGRVLITPAGQLALLDSIYADPLERLKLTRRRLWAEFRLAFPSSAGVVRFDKGADLGHAAMVAAALTVGRPLRDDDYPDGIPALRQEILEIASIRGSKGFADAVDKFFAGSLPLTGKRATSSGSADEAAIDLRKLVRKELGINTCRTALVEFFQQVDAADAERIAAEAAQQEQARAEMGRGAAVAVPEPAPVDTERQAREQAEARRLERERAEAERAENARREAERLEQERAEKARLEAERIERERIEADRAGKARLEAERIERERLEAERAEKARLDAERVERERGEQARLEVERIERERVEAERAENARLEAARIERERLEAERAEQARLEAARLERERAEQARLEAERIARERLEAERAEQARLEAERLERERIEQARLEAERIERERLEAERAEKARLEAERIERERLEAERAEKARLEAERIERERLEAERVEKARLEAERLERERIEQARLEAERIERERLEAERAEKARLEAERLERERIEKARLEAERLERERIEAERAEKARLEAERLERERIEKARLEAERIEKARLEAERIERERLEAERVEKARLEAERIERERIEKARLEAERRERERIEAERAEKARLEAERLERERVEKARLEAERAEKARLEAERLERERVENERRERVAKERAEKARLEAERAEKARAEAERLEGERADAERRERELLEAARAERERAEKARAEADRLERERVEQVRLEAEREERDELEERSTRARIEAERVAAEQVHTDQRELDRERERQREKETAPAAGGWLVPPDRAGKFEPAVQEAPPAVAPTARSYPIYVPPAEPSAWSADMPVQDAVPEIEPMAATPPIPLAGAAPAGGTGGIRFRDEASNPFDSSPARSQSRSEPEEMSAAGAYEPFKSAQEPQAVPWKLIAAGVVLIAGTMAITRGYSPSSAMPIIETVRKAAPKAPPAEAPAPAPIAGNVGRLTITTEPIGAKVTLDGKAAGETPLTVDSVKPGRHTVVLTAASGVTAKRTVRVESGQTLTVDVGLYSGFAAISAPFVLDVSENGKGLGTSEEQILLSPGSHTLRVANKDLGYVGSETVEIQAGEVTRLSLDPRGRANINAAPWAEVWIDGEKAGDTPLANVAIRLGIREIVFKNPQFGERKVTTTIKANAPATISIDFSK